MHCTCSTRHLKSLDDSKKNELIIEALKIKFQDANLSNILTIKNETLVASGTFSIPNLSQDDYHTFSFNDSNFCYNGTDNIVIFWMNVFIRLTSFYQRS